MNRAALLLSLIVSLSAVTAHAEKMDMGTHTLVIEKLERVLTQLEKDSPSQLPTLLRLADLYAERARLAAMEEVDKNCNNCLKSRDDRRKSIARYETAFKTADTEQKGRILFQMAHLYELIGQSDKAVDLYLKIIRTGAREYPKAIIGQAHAGLGEIYYKRAKFSDALSEFTKALNIKETEKRGYITYRVAWCQLNLGRLETATNTLISILKSPQLLMRDTTNGPQLDEGFQTDVSHDLATFLARGTVGPREIQALFDLSPDTARKSNLFYLATETDRVGKKQSALVVWDAFLRTEASHMERLEAQIRIAQLQYDVGQRKAAIEDLQKAIDLWKKGGCPIEDECGILKSRLRKFVTDWNRAHKRKPTEEMFKAYAIYTSLFSDDTEMHYWAAQVARDIRQYRQAIDFYHRSSLLALEGLKKADAEEKKKLTTIFEGSLLGEIEMAELTKDAGLRLIAYDHYLKHNPTGPKQLEVSYQRAHVYYERGQHKEAAVQFHAVAIRRDLKQDDLRKKAADLSLDSLVILKDEERLEAWALEFAPLFPAARDEYYRIARKAALNQVAKITNDSKSSSGQLNHALNKMKTVNLTGATHDEKVLYFKNTFALAQRTENLKAAEQSVSGLLALKLNDQEKEEALGRRVWIAEMQLDFGTAYNLSRKMKLANLSEEERHLRLAMLAELAGRNTDRHYADYLKSARNRTKANIVRARLVRQSRHTSKELDKHLSELEKSPEILAPLALEVYARHRNVGQAEKILKNRRVQSQPAGQTLTRFLLLRDFAGQDRKVSQHRINGSSDALMQKTLKERVNLLQGLETTAGRMVGTGDYTLQVVTLAAVGRENERLYKDILALPVPRRLNAQQREEYQKVVAQQAQPYLNRSKQVQTKLGEFWKNNKALDAIAKDYRESDSDMRALLVDEVRWLASLGDKSASRKLNAALGTQPQRPSHKQILNARQDLRENPFSLRKLDQLRDLEKGAGGETMVAYLDARKDRIQSGDGR